jgi:hypothetical protein
MTIHKYIPAYTSHLKLEEWERLYQIKSEGHLAFVDQYEFYTWEGGIWEAFLGLLEDEYDVWWYDDNRRRGIWACPLSATRHVVSRLLTAITSNRSYEYDDNDVCIPKMDLQIALGYQSENRRKQLKKLIESVLRNPSGDSPLWKSIDKKTFIHKCREINMFEDEKDQEIVKDRNIYNRSNISVWLLKDWPILKSEEGKESTQYYQLATEIKGT